MSSENNNRRKFLKIAGTASIALPTTALFGNTINAKPNIPIPEKTTSANLQFPEGFKWGVATAAYQIEGAANADGKGKSIWDTYSHIPGKMKNGDTGDIANDHYNRYKEDIAMMKDMGVTAYRFSIAWPRIFPNGTGNFNTKGIDFYKRLTDELNKAGIEPYATLYHWDLPQVLQDKGGWQNKDTAKAFGDYAGRVASELGDRVKHYFTLNEFQNFVDMGHRGTEGQVQGKKFRIELAPGLQLSTAQVNQVAHHAVLSHGYAVQAIRAQGVANTQIGPAEVMFCAIPIIDTPEYVKVAEKVTKSLNARFLDVMLTGKYADSYLQEAGVNAPKFTDEDLRAIASPIDFVGTNIYIPKMFIEPADNKQGYKQIPTSVSHPKMFSFWHTFSPEVLYWGPRLTNAIWKPKSIYITENGCAGSDIIQSDGRVYDTDRVMYLRNVMMHLHRAISEGAPVKGNFLWSLMDNLEWTDGYGTRFGLVHVDFKTQKRTPKLSASWFKEAASRNAIV